MAKPKITSSPVGKPADVSMEDHKYDDYAVQSAFDTLMRAEEHKQDPKMMKAVHAKLSKQKRAIKSIQDLKTARNEMMQDDDED